MPIPLPVLISVGAQVGGSLMSYTQAAQQKKYMKEAEAAAAKAVADARAKLTQAPLERLQVPTEAYETAQREITAQSMQAIEAAREAGARELAASVGRVGALGLTAAEKQREAMAQDIYKRDLAVAEDEARRLGLLSNLDVREAFGAQVAAAQAEEAAGKAMTSGTMGLVNAAGTLATGMPLYKKAREAAAGMEAAEGIGQSLGEIGGQAGSQIGQGLMPGESDMFNQFQSQQQKLKEYMDKNYPTGYEGYVMDTQRGQSGYPNVFLNQVSQSVDPYMMFLMGQYNK